LPKQEERQREEERKAATRPQTVGAMIDRFVEGYCRTNLRRWQPVARVFEMHVKPALGGKPLYEFRRADVVEMLDDLQNRKGLRAQVNRVRAWLRRACEWSVEREYLDANPVAATKKRKVEARRTRVLSEDELRATWHAANRLSEPRGSFIKALILTGQRRDEVRCMVWSEIDLSRALWTLPAARNKSKREHEVPLSPAMVELLGTPRPGPVFTIDGRVPYSAYHQAKIALDRESGVTGWRLHDLRRTVSTGMAALHVSQDTIERVLNHAIDPLAQTYNRHEYLNEKRRALELWAERVAVIVGDGRDAVNVVELRAGT
jgi:integrase